MRSQQDKIYKQKKKLFIRLYQRMVVTPAATSARVSDTFGLAGVAKHQIHSQSVD